MKKRTLLSAILTVAMCLSLAVGATFALFTSSSEVNIAVTSASVDVRAVADDLESDIYSGTASLSGNQITVERMVPGDSFTFDIHIVNYSDVTVQYRTIISNTDGGLFTALRITLTENGEQTIYNGGYVYQNWAKLLANDEDPTTPEDIKTIKVLVEFPDNGLEQNQYQDKSCTMNVLVEAVQGNAFVENPIDYNAEANTYIVNNEQGMMLMNGMINEFNRSRGNETINFVLNDDMDMAGYDWLALDYNNVNLDGQGHTISNLKCVPNPTLGDSAQGKVGFAATLSATSKLSNVTFANVTAVGDQAGVVAGSYEGGVIEGVAIDGECTVAWEDEESISSSGIGVVFGLMSAELPAVSTTPITVLPTADVTVDYNDLKSDVEATGSELCFNNKLPQAEVADEVVDIVGSLDPSVGGTIILSNNTYLVYNLDNLLAFAEAVNTNSANENNFIGNAVLYADVDLTGVEWTSIGNGANRFAGTFDGQGHTISGLTYLESESCVGFFGGIVNANIKNVNFDSFNLAPANGRYVSVVSAYAFGDNNFENVTISNATVSGVAMVGGFIGCVNEFYVENNFTNCTITDSKIVVAYDGGTFIGYSNYGCDVYFDNCFATNIDIQLTGLAGGSYYEYKDGVIYRVWDDRYFASAGKLYSYEPGSGGIVKNEQAGATVENVTYICALVWKEEVVYPRGLFWNGIDTFYVETAEGLLFVAEHANKYAGDSIFNYQTISLISDIDLAGIDWKPISENNYLFCTTFDGNGHTISNLTQNGTYSQNGFIGALCYGGIKNVKFVDATVRAADNGHYVGLLVGMTYGNVTFENVVVDDFYVLGTQYVGTMVGFVPANGDYNVNFINCTVNDGHVVTYKNGGGYIGYAESYTTVTFTNCILNDMAFELTGGKTAYTFDEYDRLYLNAYSAFGILYCGGVDYVGTPFNSQQGITLSKLYYYFPDSVEDLVIYITDDFE